MNIGIVGLGLIGGSFAKAYSEKGHTVYACDVNEKILSIAKIGGFIDGELNDGTIGSCDIIILSAYPGASVEYFRENAPKMKKSQIVIDCCGVKRNVCGQCFETAKKYGLTFVGGHPMAGKHQSGFKYSSAALYRNATMILVPEDHNDIFLIDRVKKLLLPVEFGRVTVTTPDEHDRIIAFTSQMAHVVSNAFIKSPIAREHKGFSAGSYKDLTRVAWLNEDMWTELFMDNRDYLIGELDIFISAMSEYRDAMAKGDYGRLRQLLHDGKCCKEEVDGR